MYQHLTGLRSLLRRLGVLRPVARLLRFRTHLDRQWARRRYRKTRPETARIEVGPVSVELRVLGEDHYALLSASTEAKVAELLVDRLSRGDVFWDVGANIGFYSILAAAKVGPEGRVYAFEPLESARRILSENVRLNALRNVEVVPVALADRAGSAVLVPEGLAESGTHRVMLGRSAADGVEVELTTGDAWCNVHRDAVPNFVKIDVEGVEPEVLAGLANTLRSSRCRTLIVEVHFAILDGRGQRDAPTEIVRATRKAGFEQVSWLDSSHLVARKSATGS